MALKLRRVAPLVFTVLMLTAFSFPLSILAPTVRGAVLYDSGNPTPAEQLILEYVNRARSNPVTEGQRLGIVIHEGLPDPSLVGPRPPLAMNKILLSIAQAHSLNMYNQNYFSHNDPNGNTPFDRMTLAGYSFLTAGENMAGGQGTTAAGLEDLIMVDAGTSGRGHRVNLLDLFNTYPCGNPPCVYSEVGIGYYEAVNPNGIGLNSLLTQDFGAPANGPFLLGVVYNDQNNNNFYDIGEGIAGVTITPSSGGYYAVSSLSGGYVIPIGTSGTITVTASGQGFGPFTKTMTLNGANVKLDFTASAQISSTTTTSISTSSQTSTTSTITTSSTVVTTSSTQTTTSVHNAPSISLNPISASTGSTVHATGSGFSSSDTICQLSGIAVGTSSCSISGGTLTASFVVANVAVGSYVVAAIGSPVGDFASTIFTLSASTSQTTTSTSSITTLSSTSTLTQTTLNITTISSSTTSSSSSQQTTTVNAQTSTTNTPPATPDFSLSASSSAINLAQSSTGDLIVSVQSVGPFDQQVHLAATGLPDGVQVSFSPDPISPSEGGTVSSTATLLVTRSVPTGIYQFTIVATSGSVSKQIQLSLRVSGCLIATATFGSELAPEVQFLRDFRDHKILQTFAGTSFMIAFNAWYYSFSPGIAQYESINPAIRVPVKIMIYPLIWILQIGSRIFDLFSFNHEAAAVSSGITISALLGTIYLAGPLLLARRRLSAKMRRVMRTLENASFLVLVGSLLIVIPSEVLKAETLMTVGSSIVILSTIMTSALLSSRTLATCLGAKE